jgi:hypothetical protein
LQDSLLLPTQESKATSRADKQASKQRSKAKAPPPILVLVHATRKHSSGQCSRIKKGEEIALYARRFCTALLVLGCYTSTHPALQQRSEWQLRRKVMQQQAKASTVLQTREREGTVSVVEGYSLLARWSVGQAVVPWWWWYERRKDGHRSIRSVR